MKTPLFLKSYRQQNLLLFAVTMLLLLIIFNLPIKRTIAVYKEYQKNQAQVALAADAPSRIAKLQHVLTELQSTNIKPYQREALLEKTTSFCNSHNLLVKSFPEAITTENNGARIINNYIQVEGGYLDMVQLLYHVEEREMLGSVSAAKFQVVKDRQLRKNVLRGTFLLRNLENTTSNE